MITPKESIQIDKATDETCKWVSLNFYVWTKQKGWLWLEGQKVWHNGIQNVNHEYLWDKYVMNISS